MTASRGASSSVKRRPEASSSVAPSPRTASVISSPSKRVPGQLQRGRVELAELEVGQVGARGGGHRRRRRRSRPRGLLVRRHSAAAPPVASTVAAAAIGAPSVSNPWQRSPSLQSATADVRSRTSMRGSAATIAASFEVISCPVWLPPAVDDAAPGVSALEAQRELAARRRGRRRRPARAARAPQRAPPRPGPGPPRPAEPAPGGDRVGGVLGRASRRARAPRPARPGPRSWRSGRAACARSRRRGRPARPRAAPSTVRPRRRRRRRRRTRTLAVIAAPPLGGSPRPDRAASAAAASRARASGRRSRPRRRGRSAFRLLDPLLRRFGLLLDLRQALLGGGDRPSLPRARASSSAWAATERARAPRRSSWRRSFRGRPPEPRSRPSRALPPPPRLGRLPQPALGRLDLGVRSLPDPRSLIGCSIYYLDGRGRSR